MDREVSPSTSRNERLADRDHVKRDSIELQPLGKEDYLADLSSGESDFEDELGAKPEEPSDAAGYSREEEAAVLLKLDRHLVLFLALLYMLSFLDRSSMKSLLK